MYHKIKQMYFLMIHVAINAFYVFFVNVFLLLKRLFVSCRIVPDLNIKNENFILLKTKKISIMLENISKR